MDRRDPYRTHRRRFLGGLVLSGLVGRVGRSNADDSPIPGEPPGATAARRRAVAAGLKGLVTARSTHYVAVGDAPGRFLSDALGLCEKLAAGYLDHLGDKGFSCRFPDDPMTVVALAGRTSYEAFKEGAVAEGESGHYDLMADRLVIFETRDTGAAGSRDLARRVNTLSLVHEAIHQLTFSTGLLRRSGDVPVAVSEGLATYGELWQNSRPTFGEVNRPRLAVLFDPKGGDWIPIARLIEQDDWFDRPESVQAAYATAWLFIHHLVKTKSGTLKLRNYLDRIRPRDDGSRRLADAAEALGDLERLDRELKRAANLLARR